MRLARKVVLLAAFVAACAQVPIQPPEGPLEFSLAGRIAARYGSESFTGNINWRHAREGDELLISTPTGQGVAQIVRQGDAVLLKTAEPREYHLALFLACVGSLKYRNLDHTARQRLYLTAAFIAQRLQPA